MALSHLITIYQSMIFPPYVAKNELQYLND